MTMRVTLLFEPRLDRSIPFGAGPEGYQRLAEELSRCLGFQVPVVTDVLQNAPPDSFVLFAGCGDVSRSLAACGPALAGHVAPRIVLLDVSWQGALEQLERHRLAGAVDSLRLSEWMASPSSCTGPFGLRYLAKPLGAACVSLPAHRSVHYCLLQSDRHRGMPHLLADYLTAYHRDQQPLSAVPWVRLARSLPASAKLAVTNSSIPTGPPEETVSACQVESVRVHRVIDLLKSARRRACVTSLQIAEGSGLDREQLDLLEGSDYQRAKLGALRAYVQAVEASLGWTLAGTCEPTPTGRSSVQRPPATGWAKRPAVPAFAVAGRPAAGPQGSPAPPVKAPIFVVAGGLTVLRKRRARRRRP